MAEEIKGLDAFFSGQSSAPDLRVDDDDNGVKGLDTYLNRPSDAAITNPVAGHPCIVWVREKRSCRRIVPKKLIQTVDLVRLDLVFGIVERVRLDA